MYLVMSNMGITVHPSYISDMENESFDNPTEFKRHLIFKNGLYIKNNKGLLYCTAMRCNISPFTMVLTVKEYDYLRRTLLEKDQININIDTSNSSIVRCHQLPLAYLSKKNLETFLNISEEVINDEISDCIIIDVIDRIISGSDMSTLTKIIGSGEGLTPSSDDFLLGLMWVTDIVLLNNNRIKYHVEKALKTVKTTSVSSEFYSCALKGFYSHNLIRLGNSIRTGRQSNIKDSITEILDFGHNSGKFLLYGVIFGIKRLVLQLNNDIEGS